MLLRECLACVIREDQEQSTHLCSMVMNVLIFDGVPIDLHSSG